MLPLARTKRSKSLPLASFQIRPPHFFPSGLISVGPGYFNPGRSRLRVLGALRLEPAGVGALVMTCMLRIGDRAVLATSGAPEVEYALFEPSDVDLAATGFGTAREVAYRTTAEDAITRLDSWEGAIDLIDAVEATRGKQPVTDYLRLRAAFIDGRDNPRRIGERVSSLALASPGFLELQLLAMEVWNAVGDLDRALLFAGDLLSGEPRASAKPPVYAGAT